MNKKLSFNTASGKYYCNKVDAGNLKPGSVVSFNTASGKYYCNDLNGWKASPAEQRFNTASGKYYCNLRLYALRIHLMQVSIPQAVSTIAIKKAVARTLSLLFSFNTASGKYYCNKKIVTFTPTYLSVSIPQAVSTIAIAGLTKPVFMVA